MKSDKNEPKILDNQKQLDNQKNSFKYKKSKLNKKSKSYFLDIKNQKKKN